MTDIPSEVSGAAKTPATASSRAEVRFLFLHLLNSDIQSFAGLTGPDDPRLLQTLRTQVRLGVLAAERGVVVPAASLFEVDVTQRILVGTVAYQRAGLLWLYSPTADLEAYAEKKLREYATQRDLFGRYDQAPAKAAIKVAGQMPWLPRLERSAFTDISTSWRGAFESGGDLDRLIAQPVFAGRRLRPLEVAALERIPEWLDGRAFILRNVLEAIPGNIHPRGVSKIATLNNRAYVLSYISEHSATILVDTDLGDLSFGISGAHPDQRPRTLSWANYFRGLRAIGIGGVVASVATQADLIGLNGDPVFRRVSRWLVDHATNPTTGFDQALLSLAREIGERRPWFEFQDVTYFLRDRVQHAYEVLSKEVDLDHGTGFNHAANFEPSPPARLKARSRARSKRARPEAVGGLELDDNTRSIFLVHGKDAIAARWMRDFLRALGLEPLEWSQAVALTGSGSPFVLDVVRRGMAASQATVVLFTPDEETRLVPSVLGPGEPDQAGRQSRPNVWFEAGLAMAMKPEQTIFVSLGPNRPASDLAGVHFVYLTPDHSSLHDLATRLSAVGCAVNQKGTDYLAKPAVYSV